MKELSIKEKAKAYDKAIELIKKCATDKYGCVIGIKPSDIFSELKESEGEKIRKQLITQFTEDYGKKSSARFAGIKVKDIIAWLEKSSKKISLWKHWKNGIAGNGEGKPIYLVKVGNTYSLTSCLGFECDYIELSELDGLMLEKQGEQKPDFCHHEVDFSGCSEEYRKAYYDGWNNCNMQHSQCKSELDDVVKCLINGMKFYYEDNEEATWGTDKWSMSVKHIIEVLEKYGSQNLANSCKTCKDEQKPADKIEPKFKVGDWIVCCDYG